MDRRQVHDVEAHVGDRRQPLGGGGEGAGPRRVERRALRAGEELVPGTDQCALALDAHGVLGRAGHPQAQRVGCEHRLHRRVADGGQACGGGHHGVPEQADGLLDGCADPPARQPLQRLLVQPGALLQLELDVQVGRDLDGGAVLPGGDRVAPRLDAERPGADRGGYDPGAAPVRARRDEPHRGDRRRGPVRPAQHDVRADRVVALTDDRGEHLHGLAHDGLGGPRPCREHRRYVLDPVTTGGRDERGCRRPAGSRRRPGTGARCRGRGVQLGVVTSITTLARSGRPRRCEPGAGPPGHRTVGRAARASDYGCSS